jgi:hypothetical protein
VLKLTLQRATDQQQKEQKPQSRRLVTKDQESHAKHGQKILLIRMIKVAYQIDD